MTDSTRSKREDGNALGPGIHYVTVDGVRYDVLNPADMTLVVKEGILGACARLRAVLQRLAQRLEELTEEVELEILELEYLERLRALIAFWLPGLPASRLGTLTEPQLRAIVAAVLNCPLRLPAAVVQGTLRDLTFGRGPFPPLPSPPAHAELN